jgi:hypothetical protein
MADDSRWYTTAPSTLKKVLSEIPSLGTPKKANSSWLASIGHGGGNNQSVLRVLKNVGLIAADGSPSEIWPAFKGGDKQALAEGIRAGYRELFAIYSDAYQKDAEALRSFFRANTGLAEKAQQLCVQTFQNLCNAAEFTEARRAPIPSGPATELAEASQGSPRSEGMSRGGSGVDLVVNIQLQLPPSADGEVYDKLFEAMAKHLRGLIRIE